MLFSVLMANFNNAEFIGQSIQSVIDQTYANWELIIYDDGSLDNSVAIIKEYNDERIRLIESAENKGVAYAKHKCISEANGELCGFLDPDDALAPEALQQTSKPYMSDKTISLVYTDHYSCDDRLSACTLIRQGVHTEDTLIIGKTPNHFTVFSNSAYFRTLGINLDFKRAVDRDLVLRLEEVGTVCHIPEPLYYYRNHPNSISNYSNRRKAGYWAWMARFDACDRRGLDTELYYQLVMEERDQKILELGRNQVMQTRDYQIGSILLMPFRKIKRILSL